MARRHPPVDRHDGDWIGVAVACAVLYLAPLTLSPLFRAAAKAAPVLCLAAGVVRRRPLDRYAYAVLIGLFLSAIGDMALETPGGFLPGVLAFMAAHLAYLRAFTARAPNACPAAVIVFALWGCGIYAVVYPHLGAMAGAVAIYVGVICAMMWRAVAAAAAHRSRAAVYAATGALLFGVSDSLIALARWYRPEFGNGYVIMGLYWAGQTGIALSARDNRARCTDKDVATYQRSEYVEQE